jgi:vancomycin resistance protein YoaR
MLDNPRSRPSARNQTASRKRRRKRKRLFVAAGIAAVVFLFLLAMLIDATIYHGRIHAGVVVSGVQIGGMKPDQAKAALDARMKDAAQNQVTLTGGGKTWTVSPDDVGFRVDSAATVSLAMGASRKGNFLGNRFRGFLMYFKDRQVALQGTVDTAKFNALVTQVAQAVDVPPLNAGLAFDGVKIKTVQGQKGRVVDQKALATQLTAALLSLKAALLPLPMTVKDPTVVADDYDQALQQAETMTDSPVTLTNGGDSWTLATADIIAYMDFKAVSQGGKSVLVPFLSAEKMALFLDDVAAKVKTDPVSATFKGDGTRAWVVAGVPGKKLDPEKTVEALNAAALDANDRSAKVALVLKDPSLTTDEAKAMGIKDVLGSYQTQWVGTTDRQVNVKIATQYTSNTLMAPGDVFDFDAEVGPRTADRGFRLAPGITHPGQLEDVLGGGICQVATTLFNAAFVAGLDIVERKNHSMFVPHYPKGRDATVSAGGPNLRFRNDTKHYILVRGASDGITTKFVIYGTDDGRTVSSDTSDFYDIVVRDTESTTDKSLGKGTTSIVDAGQDGKKIKVVRTVKAADGTVIHKDVFVSIWPMLPERIVVGAGTSTGTTSKSTSTTSKSTSTTKSTTTTVKSTTTSKSTTTTTAA